MAWNTDAQFADYVGRSDICTTPQLESFLDSYDQFIIVASKGMGKTLLMRVKRDLIASTNPSILLLPKDSPLDYVELPQTFGRDFKEAMRNASFWEDIWKLSIGISMLLNVQFQLTEDEKKIVISEVNRIFLPQQLSDDLRSSIERKHHVERPPSNVLDILLQFGKKNIEKMRASSMQVIKEMCNKCIDAACFVFIDSFDQALSKVVPDDLDIWCAAQNGLLKAAWEVSRHNRHIKVYVSVRQEAYSSFANSERINIQGSVLLIEYTKDQLKDIFLNSIKKYEGKFTIEEFVGSRKIYNGYLRIHELPFDYIYRHIIGVPRWLMMIGTQLSALRQTKGIIADPAKRKVHLRRVSEIVNSVSADDLAYEYLRSEMRIFFQGHSPEDYIDRFLVSINSSVLSFSSITRISEKLINGNSWTGTAHPFCLLFNLGLLGYVNTNASSVDRYQHFKKPYQYDWNHEQILPRNPNTYYLIHPSLHNIMQKRNYKFKLNKVCVGDGVRWSKKEDAIIDNENVRMFISYTHDDWSVVEGIADCIENYMNEKAVIHDIWLDRWKMRGGKWVQDQIIKGLTDSEYLIFIVSKKSLGSNAVEVEWKSKFREKFDSGSDSIIPLIIDDTTVNELPEFLKAVYHYRYEGDFSNVMRLADDILHWKSEGGTQARRKKKSK